MGRKIDQERKNDSVSSKLDEVGARAEGLSKLASCWEEGCECTESLDVKQIRDDLKAKEAIRFENLSLICESCLAKNEQPEVEEPTQMRRELQIGFVRKHGFIRKNGPQIGFRRMGFNSTTVFVESLKRKY